VVFAFSANAWHCCFLLMPGTAAAAVAADILPGWGLTFDAERISGDNSTATAMMAIKPCPANTYGVANITFGLYHSVCKVRMHAVDRKTLGSTCEVANLSENHKQTQHC
jgi:hypothetical protein